MHQCPSHSSGGSIEVRLNNPEPVSATKSVLTFTSHELIRPISLTAKGCADKCVCKATLRTGTLELSQVWSFSVVGAGVGPSLPPSVRWSAMWCGLRGAPPQRPGAWLLWRAVPVLHTSSGSGAPLPTLAMSRFVLLHLSTWCTAEAEVMSASGCQQNTTRTTPDRLHYCMKDQHML